MGISGAGKSTVIKNIAPKFRKPYTVVNRDSVRELMGLCGKGEKIVGTPEQENEVTRICNDIALTAAARDEVIFFDNMNLMKKYRDEYKTLLADYDVEWNYHYVEAPSLSDNLKRRDYPSKVLDGMVSRIEWPTGDEYDKFFFYVTDSPS